MKPYAAKGCFSSSIFFTMMAVISLALLSLTTRAAAQDAVGSLSDDDNAPDEVAENSPANAPVGITALAEHSTNYTLIDSVDGLFAINPLSGVVSVARDLLDHEAFSTHRITIQASNAISNQTTSRVIRVTDVPEPIGHIADIDFNPNKIILGARRGTPVGITARAVDPDQGSAVNYSLSKDSTGLFIIGQQDGVVTLASDSYNPDQDYLIEVTAMSDDNSSSTAQFTVMRDEPIGIALMPAAPTLREGESQVITFSFARADIEIKDVSAGGFHNCAVTSDNDAVCWGSNADQSSRMPAGQSMPPADKKFIAVGAGGSHTCGISADNDAACWGLNDSLQSSPPTDKKFIAISAGASQTCAITTDNDAACWGVNASMQTPQDEKFIAISAGGSHTCAITADNDATCLGDDSFDQNAPPSGRKFIAISGGANHTCAITLDNKAVCWGSNASGQSAPPKDKKFIAISAGMSHTCGITADNDAVCWGSNTFGRSAPPANKKFIAVSAGSRHTCAITAENRADCWGSDRDQLRAFVRQNSPPRITPIAADSVTITATISDADREQISFSGGSQAVILAGLTQTTLAVTAGDDNIIEPDTRYTISFSVQGHAAFERDEIILTIPVDNGDTQIGDTDDTDDQVAENSPAGVSVGITAYAGSTVAYTLADRANGRFAISATGLVTVAGGEQLDFEEARSHTIIVQATLGGGSMTTAAFTIVVTNVNEITLRDGDNKNNLAHAAAGAIVRGMTLEAAHDDDAPFTAWKLRQNSLFELTRPANSSTQGLRIKADAENLSSRIGAATELIVIVRTEHDVATMAFTVGFTEQEPVLIGELRDIDGMRNEVAENSPANTPVGIAVEVIDGATYTLTDSANDRFTISSTGLVIVAAAGQLNFEEASSHSITIEARSVNDSSSARFTIVVADVNEGLTPITDSDRNVDNELPENAAASSYTGITLSATDEDNSAIVTYALIDSADGLFLADAGTGVITLQGSLNYERSTRHAIIAQALSSDGSAPITATFVIAVTNINEIALSDADSTGNTVIASAGATVEGLALRATHADSDVAITDWKITEALSASAAFADVNLFEFSEPQDSVTQTLRIKADADLAPIAVSTSVTISIDARTAFDVASENFDIEVFPEASAEGIRLRVRVYLEGALE